MLLEIAPRLDLKNGIPEGFIVEEIKDQEIRATVFLDSDWKNTIGPSLIARGKHFEHVQPFSFNTEVAPGVYSVTLIDDRSRFSDDFKTRQGGIVVGTFTVQDLKEDRFDSRTLIRLH